MAKTTYSNRPAPRRAQRIRQIEERRQEIYRQLNRACHRIGSDNCHVCRRKFRSLEPVIGGFDVDDRALLVGSCCRLRLSKINRVFIFSTPDEPDERVDIAQEVLRLAVVRAKLSTAGLGDLSIIENQIARLTAALVASVERDGSA